jgi:hypothetical protein
MPLGPDDFDDARLLAGGIEQELRLPRGFIVGLLAETDWGFVIKLNAVFESLLNMGITRSLLAVHTSGLEDIVTRLDMADFRRGKVVIAAQLDLIGVEDKRFLLALAELRNQLAHTVENLGFEFHAWVALMTDDKRKAWAKKFTPGHVAMGQQVKFEEDPKEFVLCGAVDVMERIECSMPPAFAQNIRREASIDLSDILPLLDQSSDEAAAEDE